MVDDDWSVRQLVGKMLLAEGLDVEVAADGQEALARAAARPPALVLLDWITPQMAEGRRQGGMLHLYAA